MSGGPSVPVFRVSPVARLLSASSFAISAGALTLMMGFSPHEKPWVAIAAAAFFLAASTVAGVGSFGERISFEPETLVRRNLWLEAFGLGRVLRLPWHEVEDVLMHRKRTIFVFDKSGRKHVFDQMHPFEVFRRGIFERSGKSP
jgi:hypothetical protein